MPSNLVKATIELAESDMIMMEYSKSHGFVPANAVCFHAQQYAEKMLKAKLYQLGLNPPRSHDLLVLVGMMSDLIENYEEVKEVVTPLNEYESTSRYADIQFITYDEEIAEEAYNLAKKVPYLLGIYV